MAGGLGNKVDGDLYVAGNFKADSLTLPYNCVGDNQISASAGLIAYNKTQKQRACRYTQKYGSAVVSERSGIHIGVGSGSISTFFGTLSVACAGAATVTVDLLKNGTTVLSGVITLNSGVSAFTYALGTIASANYAAGDVFEVNVTATAGGGTIGQGLTVMLYTNENPV